MADDIVQVIQNAREDAVSLSQFIYYPASTMVERRLAPSIHTLNYYLDYLHGLELIYSQPTGTVIVNGEEIKTVRQAINDSVDSVILGDYQTQLEERVGVNEDSISNIEQSISELPVIEGKVPASLVSAGTDVTQEVKNNEFFQNQAAFPFEGSYNNVGSFELGATITQRNQALRYAADGKLYRWAGELPKVVSANSTPTSSGGIGDNAWVGVSDVALRQEIGVAGGVEKIKHAQVGIEVLSDLVAADWLKIGMIVSTKGYYTAGDGGGNDYEIVASGTGVDDGGSFINLSSSGLKAKGLFGDTVNVKQFGAVGDGVTDDASKIQSAVDFSSSSNIGSVDFKNEAYRILTPIYIPSNTTLRGAGVGLSKMFHPATHCFKNSGGNNGNENITISGFSFDAESTFDGAIAMRGVSNIWLKELAVENIKPTGVTVGIGIAPTALADCNNIFISNCYFDVEDYGIVFDASNGYKVSNVHITDCSIRTVWGSGISCAGTISSATIKGCHFSFTGESDPVSGDVIGIAIKLWQGIDVVSAPTDITVSDCTFVGSNTRDNIAGVSVANWSNNVSVSGCTFRELTYAFYNNFSGNGANNISFSNNLIKNGEFGFFNDKSSDVNPVIVGNTFRNLVTGVQSSLTRAIVSSNKFENMSGKGIHAVLADMSVVSQNSFYSIGEEAIFMQRNGVYNELCSIADNTFEACGVNADNTYPVIYLNNQSHIVSGNIIRNEGVNLPSWIIGRDAASNNCIITNNWMYGARQGYVEINDDDDVYANNRERGGIGLA